MSATLEGIFDPNASGNPPVMGGGKNLPPSDPTGHLVSIVESSMKPTSKGTGTMLALCLRILEGPNANVEGDWNLNIQNSNQTTVRIAMQELACICHAVGELGQVQDVAVLHDRPFRVVVALQSGENGEKGYTEVTKVLRADGTKLSQPAGNASAAPAPAQAAPAQAAPAQAAPAQAAPAQAAPAQAAPSPAQPAQAAPAQAAPVTPATPGGFPVTDTVQPAQAAPAQAQAAPAMQPAEAPPAQAAQAAPAQAAPAQAAPGTEKPPWSQG